MLTILERYVDDSKIQDIYNQGYTEVELTEEQAIQSYAIFRSHSNPKSTALVRHVGEGKYRRLEDSNSQFKSSITPRDSKQAAFADSLGTPEILLSIAIGPAGTGKTTLAMAHAAQRHLEGKRICLTKPTSMVGKGKAFGPVPGDIGEKYAPYLASYEIVLQKILGDRHYVDRMKETKKLEYLPIELVRGCTFEDCTFIIDEAQNLSWHELNTVISRMGEGTELIILGDLNQIDTRSTKQNTGLYQLVHSKAFRRSKITSGMGLTTQYRSPITQLVADIDEELRKEWDKKKKKT